MSEQARSLHDRGLRTAIAAVAAWSFQRWQVVIVALGLFSLLWTHWCSDFDQDVGGVIPRNALQTHTYWPLLALSIPLLIAAVTLPLGRIWPMLPAIAGFALVLGVYLARDPEPVRNTILSFTTGRRRRCSRWRCGHC